MSESSSPQPPRNHTIWLDELRLAVVFMTRLPLRLHHAPDAGVYARSMGWYPLIGAGVGLIGGAAYTLASLAALPPAVAALLAVAAMTGATGGLHDDGLADIADGFGGGRSRERTLEIMRDSRLGSYGGLALVFSVGLRASTLAALGGAGPCAVVTALVASAACSRAVLPAMAWIMQPARRDGLAATHGRPPLGRVLLALALAALITLTALGPTLAALALAVIATSATVGMGRLAHRRIGGYTGDVLGGTQQVAEIAILLVLTGLRG